MKDNVELGKKYTVDLDSIMVQELHITDAEVPTKHMSHHKEIIFTDDGQWLATELLFIPGHTAKRFYTHKDKDGVLWRFEGGRPVSKIADDIMDEFGFNQQQQQ
jgi:hypothetical protein